MRGEEAPLSLTIGDGIHPKVRRGVSVTSNLDD
jgi:hypothetical protein